MLAEEGRLKTHEEVREEWVTSTVVEWADDAPVYEHFKSESERALNEITKAATEYAMTKGIPVEGGYRGQRFEDVLSQATSVLTNLRYALRLGDGVGADRLKLWSHRIQPFHWVKAKRVPEIDRIEVESVIGQYLALPYRSEAIDRLLVDLLIAMELFSYANEMVNGVSIPGIFSTSPLKRSPLLEWLVNFLLSGLIWLIVGTALWGLSLIRLFPTDWLSGANVALGLLFLASVLWTTAWLPRTWWAVAKAKTQIRLLLDQMSGVYCELNSQGPISARHVDQRARSAANAGVIWPAPLFVLLEDILARTGRF